MATPITWRNVGGGGTGSAASLLNMGQQQMQDGLQSLQRLFQTNTAQEARNYERIKENNTQTYLDSVANAGGVEALQNPEVRAQLEAQRAALGGAIDRGATRNAIDQQVANLQRAAVTSGAYEDQQLERAQRGLIDQGVAMAQAGDMEGVKKLLADNQFLNEAKLAGDLTGIVDQGTRRQYAAEDQARQGRAEQRQIAQFRESMAAAAENRADRKEARADAREERDYRRNSKILDDAAAQAQNIMTQQEQRNPWAKTSTEPAKDAAVLLKNLEGGEFDSWLNSNAGDRRQMTKAITGLLADGVEVDGVKYQIPPAMLQQELSAIKGKWWITDNPADDIRKHFRDELSGNTGAANRAQADQAQQIRANARDFMNTMKRAKTQIGSSGTLDTSGIVAGLAALASGQPASSVQSGPNLLPTADEDLKY